MDCRCSLMKKIWEIIKRISAHRDFVRDKIQKRHKSLECLSIDEIIEKFSYKIMKKECPDFCVLYQKGTQCHDFFIEDFNCYGCYCPNYKCEIIIDKASNLYKIGLCSAKSKFGFYKHTQLKENTQYLILSCINCTVPHRKRYVEKLLQKT